MEYESQREGERPYDSPLPLRERMKIAWDLEPVLRAELLRITIEGYAHDLAKGAG